MIKFRVKLLGNRVSQDEWKETFDSYEEAKEYGDFLVDCKRLLDLKNEQESNGYYLNPEERPIPYLIIVDDEHNESSKSDTED